MMARVPPMALLRERFRWSSYGFIGGMVLGIILGWIFNGVVSWIVRFGFVALLLVPLVVVFLVWRRLSDRRSGDRDNVVVTRTVVLDRDGREERL